MRIPSLIMALTVALGLFLWFGGLERLGLSGGGDAADAGTETADAGDAGDAAGTDEAGEGSSDGAEGAEEAAEEAPKAVAVLVIDSRAQDYVGALVVRGRTEAHRRVDVPAETSGLVISEAIRRGTTVAEGDLLCQIDPGTRAADLAEMTAKREQARVDWEAAQRLSDRGFGAETNAIAARAALEAAEAALDRVKLDMERLMIRAPFDGILESDSAEFGSLLEMGRTCATILDLDPIIVSGFVSEVDVSALELEQAAEAVLVDGRSFEGKITFISRSADPETRTYRVDVEIDNAQGTIRDGMTAELRVALAPVRAHLVPQAALTLDDEGRTGVRAAYQGKVRFHPLRILRDTPDGLWVTGLPEEIELIVQGHEFVTTGSAVKATKIPAFALGGVN